MFRYNVTKIVETKTGIDQETITTESWVVTWRGKLTELKFSNEEIARDMADMLNWNN